MCDIHTVTTDAIDTSAELGQRIREARLANGLSQVQFAERIRLERSALVRIEAGERKVSALELLRISDELQLPLSHFVHRSPAAIVSRREALVEEAQGIERTRFRVDSRLEAHLRDAEQLRGLGALQAMEGLPEKCVTEEESAKDLAVAVRAYIGLPTGPLPAMTDVGERVGLYLCVVGADIDGSSLSPEPGFGVAVIGGQRPSGRRRFTAAHEIGHHVLGDEYQTDIGVAASRDDRERLIDTFAGELLLPSRELAESWNKREDPWEQLVRIAAKYRVSWAAAVRSAQKTGLVDKALSPQLHARTPQLGDFLATCGSAPQEDLLVDGVGPRWAKAVLASYSAARITRTRAVELLHGALTEDELPAVGEPQP